MRPTIYTVARQAGVSISTVSRVLNGSALVKAATREQVLKVVEELGYRPSASARGLARRSTETMALIFARVSGPFYSEIIQGAEVEARQHGYHLLIYSVQLPQDNEDLLRFLSAKVDGLILASSAVSEGYLRELQRQQIPFVLLGRAPEGIAADSITPDNRQGAYDIVTHLIQAHGYERIAFVGRSPDLARSQARYEGCCRALRDAGLPLDPALALDGDFDEPSGHRAMAHLLALPMPPQAVFCANDQMALGALAAAHERNVRVPGDVAVVGFDDIQAAAYVQPPLTTVRQEIRRQGVLAVQGLLNRVADPGREAETLVLPTLLVVRRSCGCHAPAGDDETDPAGSHI